MTVPFLTGSIITANLPTVYQRIGHAAPGLIATTSGNDCPHGGKFVLVLHNLSQMSCSTEIGDIPKGRKLTDIFGNELTIRSPAPTPPLSSLMAMAIGDFASTEQ
ncbi:hypothetical protein [Bradyrhizobium sp. LMG 9283]|uniref:hypothetical protein n=1 Tax=Bradyrhizobium sp. LMG 9283 TaxID=592064 RepID=UPI00388CEFCA